MPLTARDPYGLGQADATIPGIAITHIAIAKIEGELFVVVDKGPGRTPISYHYPAGKGVYVLLHESDLTGAQKVEVGYGYGVRMKILTDILGERPASKCYYQQKFKRDIWTDKKRTDGKERWDERVGPEGKYPSLSPSDAPRTDFITPYTFRKTRTGFVIIIPRRNRDEAIAAAIKAEHGDVKALHEEQTFKTYFKTADGKGKTHGYWEWGYRLDATLKNNKWSLVVTSRKPVWHASP